MKHEYETMGQRIAERRGYLKIKQHQLAEQLGISNNHLSSIERGKEKPSLDLFIDICNALQVTPDYLIMGTMRSNNVAENICDGLRLCSDEDRALIAHLVGYMVSRQGYKWNGDNFI